jgi:phage major head subunit gpT-like protein
VQLTKKWAGSGQCPPFSSGIGELSAKGFNNYDFTIKNLDWAVPTVINENDINDDQVGQLAMIPEQLAQRVMVHPEKLMVDLLINGDSATAFDDVAFFSNVSGKRTIDNLLAGTGVDTLAKLKADLTAAMVAMAKFSDDQGEPLNIKGNMIVCPVALENDFLSLVNSAADPTAAGGVNTYNPFSGKFTVIGDPRLDADDANDWYLLATNEIMKPLVFQKRQNARPGMEKTPHTKNWVYSVDYRGNGGYGLPHLAVKTVNT